MEHNYIEKEERTRKTMLTWAPRKDSGKMVFVEDVPTGLKCNCVCPECGKPLIAKNAGRKNAHSFAHNSDYECEGAHETMLHKLAKEVFAESGKVMCPNRSEESFPKGLLELHDIKIEKEDKQLDIRPDAEGINQGTERVLIEFFVTNRKGSDYREKITKNNLKCLEIDLNYVSCSDDRRLRDEIKYFIEKNSEHREWIENKKESELIEDDITISTKIHEPIVYDEWKWKQIYSPPVKSEKKPAESFVPPIIPHGIPAQKRTNTYKPQIDSISSHPNIPPPLPTKTKHRSEAGEWSVICKECGFPCKDWDYFEKINVCEWRKKNTIPPGVEYQLGLK